jgi:hypothetical protein
MLQWRRDKVIELRGIGLSYAEIAQQLQVSTSSIGTDVQYLREQAKENIKEYVTQHLPEQYQVCLSALDTVLKNAFVIMTRSDDNREKLQAMQLFKDTHLVKLELLSNATTIDHALKYIRSMQSEQSKKHLHTDSTNTNDDTGTSTTNSDSQLTATTAAGKQSVF